MFRGKFFSSLVKVHRGANAVLQSRNSSSVKADWIRRRRRLPSAMKHEIAAEWNGNETKVIARDTRRILQREWTVTAATAVTPTAGGGAVART